MLARVSAEHGRVAIGAVTAVMRHALLAAPLLSLVSPAMSCHTVRLDQEVPCASLGRFRTVREEAWLPAVVT